VTAAATGGLDSTQKHAVDLYCGVGLFTLPLSRHFAHVTGVEAHAKSASLAHESAKAAGLGNITFSGLTVEQWLRRKVDKATAPAVIVLDPPRTGVEAPVIESLLYLQPERIVYVSCDPATLARDAKALIAGGYALQEIRAFDMFPQTHHVETVATLIRIG
jgi:23S rRNA (uracil1939-C5)-methyltransferase